MLVCPSIVGRTFSQNLAILMLLLAESNKDSVGFRKKYANLAYSGRELRETGAQNLKACGGSPSMLSHFRDSKLPLCLSGSIHNRVGNNDGKINAHFFLRKWVEASASEKLSTHYFYVNRERLKGDWR